MEIFSKATSVQYFQIAFSAACGQHCDHDLKQSKKLIRKQKPDLCQYPLLWRFERRQLEGAQASPSGATSDFILLAASRVPRIPAWPQVFLISFPGSPHAPAATPSPPPVLVGHT